MLLVWLAFASVAFAKDNPDRSWKSANIYQISPVAFKDSDNDGFGDIQGIISKLDFLSDSGVDVLYLSPFYMSPVKDFAYDISNHTDVDPRFGRMEDIEELFLKAKLRGLKVIIDFVPNHSSSEHEWFMKSENGEKGYENFYVWHDGKVDKEDGNRVVAPNNWQSVYGGSSWEWSEKRKSFYYHAFDKQQPDLNLAEQRVLDELQNVLEFWLKKGADGFRIDAVSQLFEDPAFVDDPIIKNNLPQTYELVDKWRKLIDNFTLTNGGDNRILVPQVWDSKLEDLMKYSQQDDTKRAQLPTNFLLINELHRDSKAADYKKTIDKYLTALPEGATANWFVSNHDAISCFIKSDVIYSSAHTITRESLRAWEKNELTR